MVENCILKAFLLVLVENCVAVLVEAIDYSFGLLGSQKLLVQSLMPLVWLM